MQLHEKVAIVTGGSQGIGRAIVKTFAQEGAKVVIGDLNGASGAQTAQEVGADGGTALFVETDVAQRASVEALVQAAVEHFGRVDILVNCAAILGENGPLLELSQEVWDRVIAVNQTGVFLCAQAAAEVMARGGGGAIINISSVNGSVPQPRAVAYAAAKAAVESITRSLAIELAHYGIRANCIAPGPIQSHTPDGEPPHPNKQVLLARAGLPGEIATVALFLASDASSYITGERIAVDGGMLVDAYKMYGQARPTRGS
jgi:NAD(P)-dependent dehydrogenase (short-subunit alcohol dehydrogenase family)